MNGNNRLLFVFSFAVGESTLSAAIKECLDIRANTNALVLLVVGVFSVRTTLTSFHYDCTKKYGHNHLFVGKYKNVLLCVKRTV